jgi:hypothetical protein
MITANVMHRVFRLHYGNGLGTCFALDVDGKQYIVTAAHVLDGISAIDKVGLYNEGQVREHEARLVGMGPGDVDIAVLALEQPVTPPSFPPLPPSIGKLIYGQDLYFLGFPLGLHSDVVFATGFPLPLIKKACWSGSFAGAGKSLSLLLLDAHLNKGFSGGPVVFAPLGGPHNDLHVAGVISGYRVWEEPTYLQGQETGIVYRADTGIGLAYSIEHVLDVIRSNPIGPPTQ